MYIFNYIYIYIYIYILYSYTIRTSCFLGPFRVLFAGHLFSLLVGLRVNRPALGRCISGASPCTARRWYGRPSENFRQPFMDSWMMKGGRVKIQKKTHTKCFGSREAVDCIN